MILSHVMNMKGAFLKGTETKKKMTTYNMTVVAMNLHYYYKLTSVTIIIIKCIIIRAL